MLRLLALAVCVIGMWPAFSSAQEKRFTLTASPELIESGAVKYILPRFSLKTGVRVSLVDSGGVVTLSPGDAGTPVFQDPETGAVYRLVLTDQNDAFAVRFRDWITSEVGLRAVLGFKVNGKRRFAAVEAKAEVETAAQPTGDAALGEKLALRMCGRCHVVNKKNRFGGIGSTPSFGAMKNFKDWRQRFEAFWTLNPHPAFTQIEGVTPPFDKARPSPIAPLELTLDQVDAIMAFVIALPRKDLGGALIEQ